MFLKRSCVCILIIALALVLVCCSKAETHESDENSSYQEYDEKTKSEIDEEFQEDQYERRYYAKPVFKSQRISSSLKKGDKFSTESYIYASIMEIPIPKECIGLYVTGEYTEEPYSYYCIVDNNNTILELSGGKEKSTSNNTGYYIPLDNLENADTAYVQSISTSEAIVIFYDYDRSKINIFPGDKITCDVEGSSKNNDDEHRNYTYFADGNNELTMTFDERYARTIGVWMKADNEHFTEATESIGITLYYNDIPITNTHKISSSVFQIGDWVLIKTPTNDEMCNKIVITSVLKEDSDPTTLQIDGNLLVDHYNRPIGIIDFDQAWTSTDRCGVYDYLIQNNVPFTITGSINSVDNSISNKILDAYKSGLIDIGLYGNEFDLSPINPADDYDTIYNNVLLSIELKTKTGCIPSSFGPVKHITNSRVWNALKDNGFTAIKAGYTNTIYNSVECIDSGQLFITPFPETAMTNGSYAFLFWHGISDNPADEDKPYLYTDYSDFESKITTLISYRDCSGMHIMNMKQYVDYLSDYSVDH